MRDWRAGLLAASACALFLAAATVGTRDDPYAPNDWLFSHVVLAQTALEDGRIPLNARLLTENAFGETADDFQAATGLQRMTFYANTMWHFWNGLPLQPALLATVSATTGLDPEDAGRLPLGGVAVVLLAYAAADLLLRRSREPRVAAIAPLAVAVMSAPLALDLRVLMPSTSLVILALLLLLLLRRLLLADTQALPVALAALALLPFWYYTISYFVILLFAGFLAANLAMRLRGADAPPVVPLAVAALVPLALAGALLLNGALTSHVQMASSLGGGAAWLGGEASADYESRLNRQPWRSALLYAELAILFAPLAALAAYGAWRLAARRPVEPAPAVFAQWSVGGAAFAVLMQGAVGTSFLNRSVIYLTPVAALALAWAAGTRWDLRAVRVGAACALVVGAVVTPTLVATAAPTYDAGDRAAFRWLEANAPRDAVVYGSLDASSVLFRDHGFHDAIAFHPRTALLDDFWYGTDPDRLVPYLASVEWLVLRDDARDVGFEEFGPLREPISPEAYAKFSASPDLALRFDNGAVQVHEVGLAPERTLRPER